MIINNMSIKRQLNKAWVHEGSLKRLMVHKEMKKLLFFLVLFSCCFMLAGCNEEKNKAPEERNASNMNPSDYEKELVVDAGRFFVIRIPQEYFALRSSKIIVDSETRVQYFYHPGTTSHTLTILVDSIGAPLLYKGELPKKK